MSAQILVIDDDSEIRYSLARVLGARGFSVRVAGSGEEGIKMVKESVPDLIFLDNRMTGMGGIETLQHIRGISDRVMVVIMTAFGTAQTAIEAMKFGAFDYIMKPFDLKRVFQITENALKARADLQQAGSYQSTVNVAEHKEGIIGSSPAMQEVFKTIGQVAASEATVLITGESGTGKELIARSIWKHSYRSAKPFVAINCAAIPDNLIESELFGHEKGAFTGAVAQRIGRFEQCDGGTIFLDEIGDMQLQTQTKILRVLQEGEIQRVGGTETVKVDVRIIAATNKDLEKMVQEKTFREDLYYRLNVVRIRVPALRERLDDVPQIVDFMLQRFEQQRRTRVRKVSPEALGVLKRHRWPGNVRELENVIYRAAVVAQGEAILIKDLPAEIQISGGVDPSATSAADANSATPLVKPADSVLIDATTAARVLAEAARRESPDDPWRWIVTAFESAGLPPQAVQAVAPAASPAKPRKASAKGGN
jgi:two-component system nitrogen regulation response regulator GlnG